MNVKMSLLRMAAVAVCFLGIAAARAEVNLTFFGWSDQHVAVEGKADHLIPAIDGMNTLAETAYPEKFGGKVEKPAFVFGCGDISEWPAAAARDAYNELITTRLKIPSFDIVGNHDEGGKSPSETIKNWIISRHHALSYTFDRGGVRFIATFSQYNEDANNPAQSIHKDALKFIATELGKIPRNQPAIVALHQCLDSITNRDELVGAFGEANVILVLGGHYHKSTVQEYGGFRFVQLPSPRDFTQFTVFRITNERLLAIPYDYKAKKWAENPKVILDGPMNRTKH